MTDTRSTDITATNGGTLTNNMPKKNKITLDVFSVITDDQSGGFSAELFNSSDEWLTEVIENKDLDADEYDPKTEEGKQKRLELLEELQEDEYQNGYTGTAKIFLVAKDGKWVLEKPFYTRGGQ